MILQLNKLIPFHKNRRPVTALLPIHILWVNLVTDGLPGLAFSAEPEEPGIMRRPPRPPDESIFAHGMWQHILWVGLFVGGLSIASQAWAYTRGAAYWQTVVFTVLTVSQLFHVLAIRSDPAWDELRADPRFRELGRQAQRIRYLRPRHPGEPSGRYR